MDVKRLGVGTLAGGITVYALGWVIFQKAFAPFYAANVGSATGVDRTDRIIWAMALGALAYGALITYAMTVRTGGPISVIAGAKAGAIVGLLLWGTTDMIFYGSTNISNMNVAIVDPLLEGVRAGVTGAVIASVLSRVPGGAGGA